MSPQMPSVIGFIKSVSSSKFIAVFLVDEMSYNLAGTFNPTPQAFESFNTILTYNNADELTSAREFNGQIGTTGIKLTLANGPVIEGPLNLPIWTGSLTGTGVWTKN